MKLFNTSQLDQIKKVADKSKEVLNPPKSSTNSRSINSKLLEISKNVVEYFKDSPAILITTQEQLHDYVDKILEFGYAGIDTETTGLDRIKDHIVGCSLYVPGMSECYIPNKHLIPIFEEPYKNQLTYEQVRLEFTRIVNSNVRLIFANADFDLSMIRKDYDVDFSSRCYYDVILAWRCLKENEKNNQLKVLYNKYVLKGKGDPKTFSDFFPVDLFPYCKPEIAKLYAANDAKISYELFLWQLPYTDKNNPKCKKAHLESIADLIWNVEFPLIRICHSMHRNGVYIDKQVAARIKARYDKKHEAELIKLQNMVQDIIDSSNYIPSFGSKVPFTVGSDFNPNSPDHVKHLLYTIMKLPSGKSKSTGKEVLNELNLPVTNQIIYVRSLRTLISTFTDKLPNATASDGRIHAQFKQIGADCIVGDTIIPTNRGYFLASELCEIAETNVGNHVDVDDVVIINKDQEYESAQSVIAYKNYPTIKITTELGFIIEGTYNHPIMISQYNSKDKSILCDDTKMRDIWKDRRFKTLSEIRIGDIVEIPCQYSTGGSYQDTGLSSYISYDDKNEIFPSTYTEDFAEFLGMCNANGNFNLQEDVYAVTVRGDLDIIHRFDELTSRLFFRIFRRKDSQRDIKSVDICIDDTCIEELNIILQQNKQIPDAIWKSPCSVINSYIKGLTLDSSVNIDEATKIVEFEIYIDNELDARLLQVHLASQGILSEYKCSECVETKSYTLRFDSDNYIRFCDIIGFIERSKVMYTDVCVEDTYWRRRISNSFRVAVKSIEYNTNDVYDLHVPGTHSFISNGMISHNTGRMSSAEPNLQNIPSHASDIRHMFRATATSEYVLEKTVDENSEVEFIIDNGHQLYTPKGLVFVTKLKVGDEVIFEDGGKETILHVKTIKIEGSSTRICYDVI